VALKRLRTTLLLGIVSLIVVAVILLLVNTGVFSQTQSRQLADGSILILRNVSFTGTEPFLHGSQLERILKNAIPSNGIAVSRFTLSRPKSLSFSLLPAPGKTSLILEFKLAGTNVQSHPLVSNRFYHQFHCLIHGDRGIDFAHEFWPGRFQKYSDGYFGYVVADTYPRDADWLWLRIEEFQTSRAGGSWVPVAEFRIRNKSRVTGAAPFPSLPVTNLNVGELSFGIDGITVVTQADAQHDIWNHVVTAQFRVASNGVPLTNWDQPYVRAADASGNWVVNLATHRSLDPRYMWKLDADFEPASDLPAESILRVSLPKAGTTITRNVGNVPVSIFWDEYFLSASILTNNPNLALRFLSVVDEDGEECVNASGSWNQHQFRKGDFMWHRNGGLTMGGAKPTTLKLAIVTNVHATFYVQPVVVPAKR